MSECVLQAIGISKSFPGTKALSEVNFSVKSGEVMGLVGENGAGKSTLMRIVTGVYSFDAGELLLDDKPICFKNSLEALKAGVAIIHQELNLFKNLSVYENIYLNRKEYMDASGRINKKKMKTDAAALMQLLGTDILPEAKVYSLSIRQQQVVEIARSISANARVIIMDEPSAALTESEVSKLFEVIHRLKAQNVAVVYVSHRMNEIKQICDFVTILRDGKNVGVLKMSEHEIHDIVTQMVGREIESYYPKSSRTPGEAILSIKNLDCSFLRDITFEARANEVVCIYGLAGSGTTELSECIFGLRRAIAGEIWVRGKRADRMTPSRAIHLGIAYVPPDRRGEGIVADQSIENNIIMASFREDSRFAFLKRKKITQVAMRYRNELNIKSVDSKQKIMLLSGGNQQKVVLAKWLKTQPSVLLLNEPTRGVDIGAKAEIYALIDRLAHGGISIILISSEVPEVIGMADRVLVINKGRLACELMAEECSQEVLLQAASGRISNA